MTLPGILPPLVLTRTPGGPIFVTLAPPAAASPEPAMLSPDAAVLPPEGVPLPLDVALPPGVPSPPSPLPSGAAMLSPDSAPPAGVPLPPRDAMTAGVLLPPGESRTDTVALPTRVPLPDGVSVPPGARLPPGDSHAAAVALPGRVLLPAGVLLSPVATAPAGVRLPGAILPGGALLPGDLAPSIGGAHQDPALAGDAGVQPAAAFLLGAAATLEVPRRRGRQRYPLPAPVAPVSNELRALEYVVVDVETTGGSSGHGHRITEFAAVCVSFNGRVLEEYSALVNPERSIPPFISALTNISWEMVRDAPRFPEIAAEVERMLAGRVFVAHNAAFDWRFTAFELERATGRSPVAPVLCTVRLARRVLPEVGARSLDALTYYFGLENQARHRAFGDARVTADILARMLGRLDEHEVSSWTGLQDFLRRRKPRRSRLRQASPVSMDPAEVRPQ